MSCCPAAALFPWPFSNESVWLSAEVIASRATTDSVKAVLSEFSEAVWSAPDALLPRLIFAGRVCTAPDASLICIALPFASVPVNRFTPSCVLLSNPPCRIVGRVLCCSPLVVSNDWLPSDALPICKFPEDMPEAIRSDSRAGDTIPAIACAPTSPPFTIAAAMAGIAVAAIMPAMASSLI